jgi:hypothetical protein
LNSTTQRTIAALGASVILAGCGGGGAAVSPPVVPPASAPVTNAVTPAAPSFSPVANAATPASAPASATTPFVAQSATAGTKGNANAVSARLATPPKSGSLLIAFIGNGDTSTKTTPPAGWSAAADAAGHICQQMDGPAGTQGEQVFTHRVGAAEALSDYRFAFASKAPAPYALALLEVRNANAGAPIDACSAANPAKQSATAHLAAASLKASGAGELPLVGYAPSTSGLTVTPPAGWSSTLYNDAQTPWLTLEVEAGPATAASGSVVTPATTFGNLRTSTIVFAPSVGMLIAPAAAQPVPTTAPTAAPTSAPPATPVPTASPVPGTTALRNGVEWPTGFRPFGPSSPWNRPLTNTTSPRLLPNSDAMVSLAESGGTDAQLFTPEYGAGTDYSHPVVIATNSDPLVTPHCNVYCNPTYLTKPIRIPAQARPTSGSDHHLSVVQPDGTEIDMWLVHRAAGDGVDWKNGDTINYGGGNSCGNFYSGNGFTSNAATVGGACLGAGVVRAAELASGVIPHALFIVTACMDHAYVYPASQPGDYVCSGGGPHVPNGAHVWLDLSDAAIDALPVKPWEKTILHALHQYGAFVGDSKGIKPGHTDNLNQIRFESGAQFVPFGVPSAMDAMAKSLGWTPVSIGSATRYVGSDNWRPVNWRQHLHIVDPCYAQGSC